MMGVIPGTKRRSAEESIDKTAEDEPPTSPSAIGDVSNKNANDPPRGPSHRRTSITVNISVCSISFEWSLFSSN
jgi:hypothetical protein